MRIRNDRGTHGINVFVEWAFGETEVIKVSNIYKVNLGILATEIISPSMILLDKTEDKIVSVIENLLADIPTGEKLTFLFDLDQAAFCPELVAILAGIEKKYKEKIDFHLRSQNEAVFHYVDIILQNINRGNIGKPITLVERQSFLYAENLSQKRVLVVDTHNLYHRAYHAMNLKSKSGEPTSIVYSLIKLIKDIHKEMLFDYVVFASDSSAGNWRKGIYPEYKSSRKHDENLTKQIGQADSLLEKMGLGVFRKAGYEADDIVASAVKTFSELGAQITIYSTDKDFIQLMGENVLLYNPMKKVFVDEKAVMDKYGVRPEQFLDYLSIVGDTSDDIPGVKGLGQKGASKLLKEYESLEGIYENLENIKGAVKSKLEKYREDAYISYNLASMEDYLLPYSSVSRFEFPKVNPLNYVVEDLRDLDIKI